MARFNHFVCNHESLIDEIHAEQVTHPVHLYAPGSPLLEQLYARMAEAQRLASATPQPRPPLVLNLSS